MVSKQAGATRLLDRGDELAAIDAAVKGIGDGNGTVLAIEGGAGIGKTRLLASAVEAAAKRDLRCLSALGGELERELPFGVARQILEPALAHAGAEDRERLLAGAAALASPAVDPRADPTEAPATFATLHGLYWLTANLAAEQPLLVSVDDVQWADAPSLRFLAYLARRLDGVPILVVAAVRTPEPASDPESLEVLTTAPGSRVLRPPPLGEAAVATLIRDRLGSEPSTRFAAACHAATAGNPFLIRELVIELAENEVEPGDEEASSVSSMAPEVVAAAVLRRLSRLPDGARELARAVAVLADSSDLPTAAHVADLPVDRAGELADALAGAELLGKGAPLRFVHPLVRAAVAGALGPGERDVAHRRAAEIIARRGDDVEMVAAHLTACQPAGESWVVEPLVEAARQAVQRGAPDVAASHLRRALAEPPEPAARHELLLELGDAEVRVGDPRSIEHLQDAFDSAADPIERASAAAALGRAMSAFGRITEAVEVYETALVGLGGAANGSYARDELYIELEADLLSAAPLGLRTRARSLDLIEDVGEGLQPNGPAACKLLASLAREEMASAGSRQRAIELAERSLSGGYVMAVEPMLSFPSAPFVLTYAGELDRAGAVYDEALVRARDRGAVLSVALILALRALVLHFQGRLGQAAADCRESLETADTYEAPWLASHAVGFLVWTLIAQGELDEAEQMRARAEKDSAAADAFSGITMLRTRGELRFAQGRLDEAAADLRECGRLQESWQVQNPGLVRWRSELALVEHARGHTDAAVELASKQLELARHWDAPWVLAAALRVAGAIGEGKGSEELLREAVEVASAGGARLEQARALVELGALLRRSGSRRDSREPLREGLDLAVACGVAPLAQHAHTELVASGARPRRLRESGPDALTPAESRVAEMAASGMTNRRIAQALFVSEKTVETQLGSVFRKLEIRSRTQLPEALTPPAGAVSSPGL